MLVVDQMGFQVEIAVVEEMEVEVKVRVVTAEAAREAVTAEAVKEAEQEAKMVAVEARVVDWMEEEAHRMQICQHYQWMPNSRFAFVGHDYVFHYPHMSDLPNN